MILGIFMGMAISSVIDYFYIKRIKKQKHNDFFDDDFDVF